MHIYTSLSHTHSLSLPLSLSLPHTLAPTHTRHFWRYRMYARYVYLGDNPEVIVAAAGCRCFSPSPTLAPAL